VVLWGWDERSEMRDGEHSGKYVVGGREAAEQRTKQGTGTEMGKGMYSPARDTLKTTKTLCAVMILETVLSIEKDHHPIQHGISHNPFLANPTCSERPQPTQKRHDRPLFLVDPSLCSTPHDAYYPLAQTVPHSHIH